MNRRIFIGTDPGTKGACCVLAVADCADNERAHGTVLAVEVFDLPVVERDNGGYDLDVVTFKVALRTALVNVAGPGVIQRDLIFGGGLHAVTERPQVGGSQRFGTATLVTQAINVGAVWAVVTGIVVGMGGTSSWASGASTGGWRDELGGVERDGEALAVMALRMACPTHEGAMEFTRAVAVDGQILNDARPDRLVAVLLAEVARRRWLGTACAPKKAGTARAAKARKVDRRKDAIARAVAPLTVAKARALAMKSTWCPSVECHGGEDDSTVPPGAPCKPHNKCCEARLLDWAWRAALDLPDNLQAMVRAVIPNVDPMRTLGGVIRTMSTNEWCMSKSTAVSKEWTVRTIAMTARAEDVCKIPVEVSDVLIDHGLVQLVVGDKRVMYAPTERGKRWARTLSEPARETAP